VMVEQEETEVEADAGGLEEDVEVDFVVVHTRWPRTTSFMVQLCSHQTLEF
jgi:hypothetical protein